MKKDEISNFIEKSDKVFILTQKDSNICHDIPFYESYSGEILLTLDAQNSIFIRNHYEEGDRFYTDNDGNRISKEFCHMKLNDGKKQYFLPATSIKGMIRNNLEIMTYGKLGGKTLDKYLREKIMQDNNLHKSHGLDLSEALFGTTSLKGRIYFSHFMADIDAKEGSLKKEILMTPEPKKKKFGWKNYPICDNIITTKKGNSENVISQFIPLLRGTKFYGKVKFHNLRDFELGALLSALTFHNTTQAFHNIGFAKSLGYGKVKICLESDYDIEKFLKKFEEKMNIELFDGKLLWHKSPYIKELLNKHLKNGIKEVQCFSDINFIENEYKVFQKLREKELEKKKIQEKEEQAKEDYLKAKESDDISFLNTFIQKYKDIYDTAEIEQRLSVLQQKLKEQKEQKVKEGINALLECKTVSEAFKLLKDSFGVQPKPTPEQKAIIQEFYNKQRNLSRGDKKTFKRYGVE